MITASLRLRNSRIRVFELQGDNIRRAASVAGRDPVKSLVQRTGRWPVPMLGSRYSAGQLVAARSASVTCTALTGRTHGRTDQVCDVKILLANPEPSTHGPYGPAARCKPKVMIWR